MELTTRCPGLGAPLKYHSDLPSLVNFGREPPFEVTDGAREGLAVW